MSDQPNQRAVDQAIGEAKLSPCEKSKRGVAIYTQKGGIVGSGYNEMLHADCDGSEACRASCRDRCVHAEQIAIGTIIRQRIFIPRKQKLALVHVKVEDDELIPSGPPSCIPCAKDILAVGISWVWLYHESGWRAYSAAEFWLRTLNTHGLLTTEERECFAEELK